MSWFETAKLLQRRSDEMPLIVENAATDPIAYRLFWRNGQLKLNVANIDTITLLPES